MADLCRTGYQRVGVILGWKRVVLTLVVVYDIAQVVATAVVCFAHTHRVVGEVDIAVVAEDFGEAFALVGCCWSR